MTATMNDLADLSLILRTDRPQLGTLPKRWPLSGGERPEDRAKRFLPSIVAGRRAMTLP